MKLRHFFFFCGAVWIIASIADTIIPSNRLSVWQNNVGVPGGVPARETISDTIAAGASTATIQSAINAAASNTVVLLSEGDYTLTDALELKQGVTLRGATNAGGRAVTQLKIGGTLTDALGFNTMVSITAAYSYVWDNRDPAKTIALTGGYTQNGTVLSIASTTLAGGNSAGTIPLGMLVFIDQLTDTNNTPHGGCGSPMGLEGCPDNPAGTGCHNGGDYTSIAYPNSGIDRFNMEKHRVVATNATTITIWPPIESDDYTSSKSPQVWWEGVVPIEMAGLENCILAVTNSAYMGVVAYNSFACWIKNVEVYKARYPVRIQMSVGVEHSGGGMGGQSGSTDDYVGDYIQSGGLLVTDNFIINTDQDFVLRTINGSVFSYNCFTNHNSPSFMHASIITHGGNPKRNLFEGNWGVLISFDACWGGSIGMTVHRNFMRGYDYPNSPNNNIAAIQIGSTNRFHNFTGNVLGTSGVNTWYEDSPLNGGFGHTSQDLWIIGNMNYLGWSSDGFAASTTSLIRHMNWSPITSGAPSGWTITDNIDYQTGYSTSFADLPQSHYLSFKPAFMGFLTWPNVDPLNPTYSSYITNTAAGYRLINGTNPPPELAAGPITVSPVQGRKSPARAL